MIMRRTRIKVGRSRRRRAYGHPEGAAASASRRAAGGERALRANAQARLADLPRREDGAHLAAQQPLHELGVGGADDVQSTAAPPTW